MKNQKPIDMTKILPFLRDLYIVYKRPFHSHYLVELIGDLLIRNRLSAKWIYGDVEVPIQHVDYDQETNSIIIRGIQVSPKAVLRNAPVNAKIIDLITYEHALKQKLSLTCPIFTNFKDLSQFIGKSVEQISDILKCDNQKFFIDTVNINEIVQAVEFNNAFTVSIEINTLDTECTNCEWLFLGCHLNLNFYIII